MTCESSGSARPDARLPVLPFYDHFEDAIAAGVKTCTTRSKRYGEPGDRFRTPRGTVIKLTRVVQHSLGFVANELWRAEGVGSRAEFIDIWNQIHPYRGYRPDDVRWVHHFRRVP